MISAEQIFYNLILAILLHMFFSLNWFSKVKRSFNDFFKRHLDDQGQYLVHALSIAKFIVVFCPQVQNVAQILFDVFSGEEFYVLHGPINVLLYEVSQFLFLIHELNMLIFVFCILTLRCQHLNI